MAEQRSWLGRLRSGLARTRQRLAEELDALAGRAVDEASVSAVEEGLIDADVGVQTAAEIARRLRADRTLRTAEDLRGTLRRVLLELLGPPAVLRVEPGPAAILVVGVNGTGKTTSIGKLAWRLKREGRRVLLAAADTFRAAAADQIAVWGDRVGADVVRHRPGGDPGAVVYDALAAARARSIDVVIIDTAGRLHTKVNLMEELRKVNRVVERAAPPTVERLLVLDASTGQNAISQARLFHEAVGVTGIILAKIDGTAKGGIVVAIAREVGLPVKFLGTGEALDDLVPFDPAAFVDALLSPD